MHAGMQRMVTLSLLPSGPVTRVDRTEVRRKAAHYG